MPQSHFDHKGNLSIISLKFDVRLDLGACGGLRVVRRLSENSFSILPSYTGVLSLNPPPPLKPRNPTFGDILAKIRPRNQKLPNFWQNKTPAREARQKKFRCFLINLYVFYIKSGHIDFLHKIRPRIQHLPEFWQK